MLINLYNIRILIEFTTVNEINRYIKQLYNHITLGRWLFPEFKKYGLPRQQKSRFTDEPHSTADTILIEYLYVSEVNQQL